LKLCSYENLEIILVDNYSSDDSVSFVQKTHPHVCIIQNSENHGFAGGCNIGSKQAKGKYLLILNNDTIHEPDWILPLVNILESDATISSVQPKILNFHKRQLFDYAGASGGLMDMFCFPFSRGRVFDTVEIDNGQYDDPIEIFWASGTAFLTRKDLFLEMGGFDEDLFAHMEEIDYHWKSQLMEYRIFVQPSSVVYHMGGATLQYSSPEKTYLNHRNSFLLLLTNYSFINSVILSIPRFMMELLSAFRDVFSNRTDHGIAQFRALWWIISHPEIVIKRQKKTRMIRILKDADIMVNMYRRSLVFDYFVLKKKSYIEIFGE
jgi:GT2 family glycosyltransferase